MIPFPPHALILTVAPLVRLIDRAIENMKYFINAYILVHIYQFQVTPLGQLNRTVSKITYRSNSWGGIDAPQILFQILIVNCRGYDTSYG